MSRVALRPIPTTTRLCADASREATVGHRLSLPPSRHETSGYSSAPARVAALSGSEFHGGSLCVAPRVGGLSACCLCLCLCRHATVLYCTEVIRACQQRLLRCLPSVAYFERGCRSLVMASSQPRPAPASTPRPAVLLRLFFRQGFACRVRAVLCCAVLCCVVVGHGIEGVEALQRSLLFKPKNERQ